MESQDKKDIPEGKDPFSSIATTLVALTLFYTILFQLLISNIETSEFWKQVLIFLLLLITFFFSVIIYINSQKQNDLVKAAGFLVGIFWIAIYLYLNKIVINMVSYFALSFKSFFDSSINLGLGWLIIIPLFGIPLVSIIFCLKYFKSLSGKKKTNYWIYSIIISGVSYLSIKYPQYAFNYIAKATTLIPIAGIQVLLAGILMGVMLSLIVAPVYPLLFEIMHFAIEFLKKKKK